MLIKTWLMSQDKRDIDDKQFLRGIIPEHDIEEPALDRYRDFAGVGDFDMSQYELDEDKKAAAEEKPEPEDETVAFPPLACFQERELTYPALDRYRDYAGIGPFDPDDIDDACYDHRMLGFPVPNCTCTFCRTKAEKSRKGKKEEEEKDPCAKQAAVQTLYIEQPVYREPAYDKERLFKEKNIKGYEPFGPIFQQDEHYEDEGLQPPDPFQEHPVDRDVVAESPEESPTDDPDEAPVPSPESCEEETPEETPACPAETPAAAEETPAAAEKAAETGPSKCETLKADLAKFEKETARVQVQFEAKQAAAEEQAPAAAEEQAPEATEETAPAAAEEPAPEVAEEPAPEAAEPETAEEVQPAAEEEPPPPPEAEPEAAEEAAEENPEGAAVEEQSPPEEAQG